MIKYNKESRKYLTFHISKAEKKNWDELVLYEEKKSQDLLNQILKERLKKWEQTKSEIRTIELMNSF